MTHYLETHCSLITAVISVQASPGQSIQSGHRKFSIHGHPCLCSVRLLLSLSDNVTSSPTRSTLLRKTGILSHIAPTFWMSLQTVWVALLFRPMQFGSGPTVFMWVRATSLFHPWGRGLPSSSCLLVCCHHRGCGNLPIQGDQLCNTVWQASHTIRFMFSSGASAFFGQLVSSRRLLFGQVYSSNRPDQPLPPVAGQLVNLRCLILTLMLRTLMCSAEMCFGK